MISRRPLQAAAVEAAAKATASVAEMDMESRLKASLKRSMKEETADPDIVPPPPAEEEPAPPNLEDLIKDRRVRLEAIRLLTEDRKWQAQESEAKKARKPITNKLKNLFGTWKVGKAVWDDWRINYYLGEGRESINAEKLKVALRMLQLTPEQIEDVIAASTTVGKPTYTLRISKVGEKEGWDD